MVKFIKSFEHAFRGIRISLHGRNLRIQLFIAAGVILSGFLLSITNWEWLVILLLIFVVAATEVLNTAIEETCNIIKDISGIHPKATRNARDIAAGAVLIVAVGSLILGMVIFIPKIANLFS